MDNNTDNIVSFAPREASTLPATPHDIIARLRRLANCLEGGMCNDFPIERAVIVLGGDGDALCVCTLTPDVTDHREKADMLGSAAIMAHGDAGNDGGFTLGGVTFEEAPSLHAD